MTLLDLPPRHREAVLYLWTGHSPKQVAAAMRITLGTVQKYISDVGVRLGGTCSPLQRIMLWQTEVLRATPGFLQLSPPAPLPTLPAHAPLAPTPGDGMR